MMVAQKFDSPVGIARAGLVQGRLHANVDDERAAGPAFEMTKRKVSSSTNGISNKTMWLTFTIGKLVLMSLLGNDFIINIARQSCGNGSRKQNETTNLLGIDFRHPFHFLGGKCAQRSPAFLDR
jgi:hypothetical protein